jgi:hypothetical protein
MSHRLQFNVHSSSAIGIGKKVCTKAAVVTK